ncbi:MAG: hypothetical protein WBQ86_16560 [Candidatus Binatus sp.]
MPGASNSRERTSPRRRLSRPEVTRDRRVETGQWETLPERLAATDWGLGITVAVSCSLVYLLLRPPLFDYDGYMYRLWAIAPGAWYNANPHHVLWNAVQMVFANVAGGVGPPATAAFQVVGIVVGCVALFFFFVLLRHAVGNRSFAFAATILLAFSPAFWWVTLQNHPYPLASLFLVLYFLCWSSGDHSLPGVWRLAAAAICLVLSACFHQAVALLIAPAAIVLSNYGKDALPRRLARSLLWSAIVSIGLLAIYILFWRTIDANDSLVRWSTSYAEDLHPPQIFHIGLPAVFARAIAGWSGSLIQTSQFKQYLADNLPKSEVLTLYGTLGLLIVAAMLVFLLRTDTRRCLSSLTRSTPLFLLAALSTLTWWGFAFSWEGATEHYWVLGTLPALLCLGLILKELGWPRLDVFLIAVALVSAWNVYANHSSDLEASVSVPEPALRAIDKHLSGHDVFIVLSGAAHGGSDYGLLLDILKMSPPSPAISIADDIIATADPDRTWQSVLKGRIDSTLHAGGKVYVAAHLFAPGEYEDLSSDNDPFAEQTNPQFRAIDSNQLYGQVTGLLAAYSMKPSDLQIVNDRYFVLQSDHR